MRRRRAIVSILAALTFAACGPVRADRAPEIRADAWLNTPPIDPGSLRGRVVLVDFWTFG